MKRRGSEDTQPVRPVDLTDPGPTPTFDPNDPPPPPTEAQARAADELLSVFDRPPTRIVPHQFHRASSNGAAAAAYSATAVPASRRSLEEPRERVLVEIRELARAGEQAPRPLVSDLVTVPPVVIQSARRRTVVAAIVGILVILLATVGIVLAMRQGATEAPASATPAPTASPIVRVRDAPPVPPLVSGAPASTPLAPIVAPTAPVTGPVSAAPPVRSAPPSTSRPRGGTATSPPIRIPSKYEPAESQ